jgi:hypothetical protein
MLVRVLIAILSPLSGKNMLYDSRVLVVGLFNQEAIIFDHFNWLRWIRSNRRYMRQLDHGPRQSD